MTGNKTALILGATGLVGQALVRQLLTDARYSRVICLLRRPMPAAVFDDPDRKLQPMVIDFGQLQDYEGYFTVNHVYCCLGTTLKQAGTKAAFRKVDFEYIHIAAQLTRAQRCDSFVWISSVGANARSKNFYLRVKGELENAIMRMPLLHHATAVRPSLLLGARHATRPLEDLGQKLAPVLRKVLVGKLRKYRPAYASEVAAKMILQQRF
ncbi:NAD-dependent epimerase/dehydratase family protein [Salinimonas marina]|uniref:NAD-dependent epimerase/dehydratase family protein n=1 Tax=Salinimonas marina TaxID=2785918 RepID=A0A7S9HDY6_9ALTE|nr:NAD(P)H-binding protein [Salinimonas marina]QPG06076.1 NAD-dependent epimerase/dehydratase family protein [Salinimonas marina]